MNQPPATIIMILSLSPTSFTILFKLGPTSKRRSSMVLPQRVELWSGTSTVTAFYRNSYHDVSSNVLVASKYSDGISSKYSNGISSMQAEALAKMSRMRA